MAIELKDIFQLIGIENAETLDEVKAHVEKTFIPVGLIQEDERIKKHVSKVIGKRIGEAETKIGIASKKFGIELAEGKFEDLVEGFTTALELKHKELADAVGKGDDAKVAELQKQVDKLTKTITEKDGFLTNALTEKEKVEQEFTGFKTSLVKNELTTKAWSSLPWSDTADDLKKKGFQAVIADKYEVRLPQDGEDTKDGLVVVNKATNERPKTAVGFVPYAELLQKEAQEAGVLKVGGHANKQTPPASKPIVQNQQTDQPQRVNRAQGHADKLRVA